MIFPPAIQLGNRDIDHGPLPGNAGTVQVLRNNFSSVDGFKGTSNTETTLGCCDISDSNSAMARSDTGVVDRIHTSVIVDGLNAFGAFSLYLLNIVTVIQVIFPFHGYSIIIQR